MQQIDAKCAYTADWSTAPFAHHFTSSAAKVVCWPWSKPIHSFSTIPFSSPMMSAAKPILPVGVTRTI